jgi:WD40 repeat protein
MSIQFQCSVCGRQFDVPEQMAGTKARCNTCGNIVTVPLAGEEDLSAGLTEISDPYLDAQTTPFAVGALPGHAVAGDDGEGLPKAAWIAIGVGGGVAALILLVLIVSSIFGGGSNRNVAENPIPVPTPMPGAPVRPERPPWPTPDGSRPVPPPGFTPPSRPPQTQPPFTPPATGREPVSAPGFAPPGVQPGIRPDTSTQSPRNDAPPVGPSVPSSVPSDSSGSTSPSAPFVPNLADMARSGDGGTATRPPIPRGRDDRPGGESADFVAWEAEVDGPAQAIEYKQGKLSIPVPSSGLVLYPNRPSNFVLIAGRDNLKRSIGQVFDLRTGKEIGKPATFEGNEQPMLFGTDGRYAAAPLQLAAGARVGIWSFVTGTMVQMIEAPSRMPEYQDFPAPHQYLVIEGGFREWTVRRWDVQTGQQNLQFTVGSTDRRPLQGSAMLTPGGRYLSVIEGDRLTVYELQEGRCVGRSPLPAQPSRCLARAFSHDGTRLAAMLDMPNGTHLVCWDFARGDIAVDYTFDTGLNLRPFYAYLQWVPDANALLYSGSLLLDGESGVDVWTFPEDRFGSRNRRLMLGLDRMLAVTSVPRSGDALTTVDLPKKDLDKVFETVRSGGMAIDTVLPQLVKANWLAARPVSVPNGFTDWSAVPDPTDSVSKPVAREVLIATEKETVKSLAFASPESGRVAVQKSARRVSVAGRSADATNLIERYDLDSGKKSRDVPLPNVYEMLDISPSGDHVLVGFRQPGGGFDRLDVIAFNPLKHVTGWRPYEGETREVKGQQSPKEVNLARFLNDSQVLTVNSAGKLAVWELPDCRAVYYFEKFGIPAAISPGRKYVVGVHDDQIRIFETATGECCGDLPTPAMGSKLARTAFRPDGLELAAIVEGRLDKSLARWDMQNGRLEHEFPLPNDVVPSTHARQTGRFGWRGNRYVLVDSKYLIDLTNRAVVWRYHVPTNILLAADSPDGRNWICSTRDASSTGPRFLAGRSVPSEAARPKTDLTTLEKQLLLGPGMGVRLDVQLGSVGSVGSVEFNRTVRSVVTETLKNRGISVDFGARLTLLISSQSDTTGTEIAVNTSRISRGTPDQIIAQQRLTCLMTLRDSSGRELWSRERSVHMRSFGSTYADNVQAELVNEMQTNFRNMLSTGKFLDDGLPTYVFGKLDEILAGQSQLTFAGEGPPPPASPPPPQAAPRWP